MPRVKVASVAEKLKKAKGPNLRTTTKAVRQGSTGTIMARKTLTPLKKIAPKEFPIFKPMKKKNVRVVNVKKVR